MSRAAVRRGMVLAVACAVLAACSTLGGSWFHDLTKGYAKADRSSAMPATPPADPLLRGAMLFAVGDFGVLNTETLQTVGMPWKLASTALALREAGPQGTPRPEMATAVLRRHGFLTPRTLRGAQGLAVDVHVLGLNTGQARRRLPRIDVEIANLGCAACHAGVGYDAAGLPLTSEAWLGSPNTSLDLEAYTQAVYLALREALKDEPRLLREVVRLHPATTPGELETLRRHILPRARQRIAALEAAGAGPLPFSNGAPGLTNGVAALKLQTGELPPAARQEERGFVSIPQLADRSWRSALLVDGAYAPPGGERFGPIPAADRIAHRDRLAAIVTYFTVPSMGQPESRAPAALAPMREVLAFTDQARPQPFPGRIDPARAREGARVYAAACAACHGAYQDGPDGPRLVSFPNWSGDVGTDPVRARVMSDTLAQRVNRGPYRQLMVASHTGVYTAPPLTGLWSSAPYLHNGSVPSLSQLMGLEPRAVRFQVGGHALDLERVGISYPAGYAPWSAPAWIDTRTLGLGAGGHEAPFSGLSMEARRNLLEYLKRL